MPDSLEAPTSPEQLYLARDDEISESRPILTGDVLGHHHTIVMTHPCSIRTNGVDLAPQILVAPIIPGEVSSWSGSYRVMPLPNLYGDGQDWKADFDGLAVVDSANLSLTTRRVTLDLFGINLLQQRWVHHLTRVVVPTSTFAEAISAEFEEIDLLEEWATAAADYGVSSQEAHHHCHDWLRENTAAGVRQELLRDPQFRAPIRREARARMAEIYA